MNPPYVLRSIQQAEPARPYEGLEFVISTSKTMKYHYFFRSSYMVPAEVLEFDYPRRLCKIKYEIAGSVVIEYVSIGSVTAAQCSNHSLPAVHVPMTTDMFRLPAIVQKYGFQGVDLKAELRLLQELYQLCANKLESKDLTMNQFCDIKLPYRNWIAYAAEQVDFFPGKARFRSDLQQLAEQIDRYFEFSEQAELPNEFTVFVYELGFQGEFCVEAFFKFLAQKCFENIIVKHKIPSDQVFMVYRVVNIALRAKLYINVENILDQFCQDPGRYIAVKLDSLGEFSFEILLQEFVQRFRIPRYVNHYLHESSLDVVRQQIEMVPICTDQHFIDFLSGKSFNGQKILKLGQLYNWQTLISNQICSKANTLSFFLSFEIEYELSPLEALHQIIEKEVVALQEDQKHYSALIRTETCFSQLLNTYFDKLRSQITDFAGFQMRSAFFAPLYDEFYERAKHIVAENSLQIRNLIADQFYQTEKLILLLQNEVKTPDKLIEIVEQYNKLPETLTAYKEQLCCLIDKIQDKSSECEGDIDVSPNIQQLQTLKKCFSEQMQDLATYKRLFSKFLLSLTDLIQNYLSQVELVVRDIMSLNYEAMENTDDAVFRRKYRWICTNIQYEEIGQVFGDDKLAIANFIYGIRQASGVDLTQLASHRYVRDTVVNMDLVFEEIIFLLQAFIALSDLISRWSTILKVECYLVMQPKVVWERVEPVTRILLGFKALQNQYNMSMDNQLFQVQTDLMLESGENICRAIKTIKSNYQYASWVAYAEECEAYLKDKMPIIMYLKMLNTDFVTDQTLHQIGQIVQRVVTKDRQVLCAELVSKSVDQQNYRFDLVQNMYNEDYTNKQYLTSLYKIQMLLQEIKLTVVEKKYSKLAQHGVARIVEFSRLIDLDLNQYLYDAQKIITSNPNIHVLRLSRILEFQIQQILSFSMLITRCRNMLDYLHCKTSYSNARLPSALKSMCSDILACFGQLAATYSSSSNLYQYINGAYGFIQKMITLLIDFDQKFYLFYNAIDYDQMLEFSARQFNVPPITNGRQLILKNALEEMSILTKDFQDLQVSSHKYTLQSLEQLAFSFVHQGKFKEYLALPYQTIMHTLFGFTTDKLREILQAVQETELDKLKKQAIIARINERFSFSDAVDQIKLQRIHSRIYFQQNYWLGDPRKVETYQLSRQQLDVAEKIIYLVKTKNISVILLNIINKYLTQDVPVIGQTIARTLGQYFVVLSFSICDSNEYISQTLHKFLEKNYIIYIIGLEYLTKEQLVTIQHTYSLLLNTSSNLSYSEGAVILVLATQIINSQFEVKDSDITLNVLKSFSNIYKVKIAVDIQDQIKSIAKEYSKQFINIICCLSGFNCPQLLPSDIPYIIARTKQQQLNQIAASTYKFLAMQTEDESFHQSFSALVKSSFDVDNFEETLYSQWYIEPKQQQILTPEGNFAFEMMQFYIRSGSIALLSKSYQLSQNFLQLLANENQWQVFWIFSYKDIDTYINYIIKSKDKALLVFVVQNENGNLAKSLFKNYLNLHIMNQPLQTSNGQFVRMSGARTALIMNSMKDLELIKSPFSLAQKRILFKPSFYSNDFFYEQFIYYPLKLDTYFFKLQSYTTYNLQGVQTYNQYIHHLCHFYTEEETKEERFQQELVVHAIKIVKILIKAMTKKALAVSKLSLDMRLWKIFRSLLAIFYFVVGLARFDEYIEKNSASADISEVESLEFPLTSYKLPQFSIENDRFLFFDFNFNSEFIQTRLQPELLYNAVTLAVLAGVVNTFMIMMVVINDAPYEQCKSLFTQIKELLPTVNAENQLQIPYFTFDFLNGFHFPSHQYCYIALTTGEQVQKQQNEESSQDNFDEVESDNKDRLKYVVFAYGKDLLNNPVIKKVTTQEVQFELPVHYSAKQSMSIPFYTACIIACVPFILNGKEKTGKSTLIRAAISMLPQHLKCNRFTISSRSNQKLVIDRILQRMQMKSNCNFYSPFSTCYINWISMLYTELAGKNYDLDYYLMFLGEQLVLASPSAFDCIQFDNFYHSKYSGKTNVPTASIIIEATNIPPQILSSQLLVFKVIDLKIDDMFEFVKTVDKSLTDYEVREFVTGINIILPFLPVSFYQLIASMRYCQLYTTEDDTSMRTFSLSLFLNALRALPDAQPKTIMTIMDQIQAALTLKLLDKHSFWGGMSLDYLQELAKTNAQLFEEKRIQQYTKWELEVLSLAKDYADKYINTQTEEESGEEEADLPSDDSFYAHGRKERPKLNILEAQGKFKKQMVMNSKLSSIEPGIFRLYVSTYEQFCQTMDPTLCNRIMIMHLNLYQHLERNAFKLHLYIQALRYADLDKISQLEDQFQIPAYIFYSFQMPSGYYNDEIYLFATLGNYQISNQSLFAYINAKRLNDEASLAESSTSFSDSASNSSSQSWTSSSKSSALSSLASSHGYGEFEYQHNIHGRRQRRMLIDIMTLLQSVTKEQRNKQHQGKKKFANQLTKALYYCIQMKGEIKAVGYAIRAAFCQALGISPLLGLQDLRLDKNAKVVPGFSTLENYPFVDEIIEQFKEFLEINQNPINCQDVTMRKLMQYNILQEPIDILVVLPLSYLYSITDTSILVSVIQLVQQSSAICDLFTEQEFYVIAYLTAINFKINAVLSPKQVLAIASRSFGLAVISDIYNVQNLMIQSTPAGRHAVIEQRMNAYLAGELDRLKFYPLFKMTNIPLINLKKLHIPTILLENEAQRSGFVEIYCRSLLAVFQYCNDHCTKNYLNISLNNFGRVSVKIIHRRIRNNLKIINGVLAAQKILHQIGRNQEYSPTELQFAFKIKSDLDQILGIMQQDYQRSSTFIKNSITDGVMIAARLIYYPFIDSTLKDEQIFEISLMEALKLDKISTFSMKEPGQVQLEMQQTQLNISNTNVNISGLASQLLGFLIEDLNEHWDFNQLIYSNIIQENYLEQIFCLISSKLLKIKFNFLNYNIAQQTVKTGEMYYNSGGKMAIIDCNSQYAQFCQEISKALVDQASILFVNFASPEQPLENIVLIQKISILLESRITHRNKMINVGQVKIVLPKALHKYNIYYSLDQRVTFEFLVAQGIANQQLADSTVVIRPQFQVFNIYQNIFKTFGLQGRQHAYREICKKMTLDFRTFTLPIEEYQLCLLNNMRAGMIQTRHFIDQLADLNDYTDSLTSTTDQQQNDVKIVTYKLLDILTQRSQTYQHCLDNMQKVRYTNQVAQGLTAILLLLAHLAHIFPPLAIVFCDNFLEDFPFVIGYKIQADPNANVRLILILNSLPFVLSKLLPMLPEYYKMPFAFMSYFYYSISFGFSKYEDQFLLQHHFQQSVSDWEDSSKKEVHNLVNSQNVDIHSAVFEQFADLHKAWLSLCSSHTFPRFMNWINFFKENQSVFTKLATSASAFDTILGNYAYKMQNAFSPEVLSQLNRRPLALPYDIQTPGNESIYSSLLLSMVIQKSKTEQIFARYHQIVPISPYAQLKQAADEHAQAYDKFMKQFEASDITINDYPLRITQLGLQSKQKNSTVVVFYDEGMALQVLINLCHKLTLQQFPSLVQTLKPTKEDFQLNSVLIDTSSDPENVLDHLIAQFYSNTLPQHILWVLIGVPHKRKLGVPNIPLLKLSRFGAVANPVYSYFPRPDDLISGFSYSMMLANGLLIIQNLMVNTIPMDALRAVIFNCMGSAIKYSKGESTDDAVLCFEIQKLIIMLQNSKIKDIDTEIQLSQPMCNYVGGRKYELKKEFEGLIFMPKNITYQDLQDKFAQLKQIRDQRPETLLNQPFRLLPESRFQKVLRDFINYIYIPDAKYVFNDQLPIENDAQFAPLKYFALIPEPMRHFMRFSLYGMRPECCKFTEKGQYNVQMADGVISMRGAAFFDVIGDMFEYLKLQYCDIFKCQIDQLRIVGVMEKPDKIPIVYDGHIGFSSEPATLVIGFSDFKLRSAVYTRGYLEDYGDDMGYEQRYFIYFIAGIVHDYYSGDTKRYSLQQMYQDNICQVNDLVGVDIAYRGYLGGVKVFMHGGGGSAEHWHAKGVCMDIGYF